MTHLMTIALFYGFLCPFMSLNVFYVTYCSITSYNYNSIGRKKLKKLPKTFDKQEATGSSPVSPSCKLFQVNGLQGTSFPRGFCREARGEEIA